MTHEHSTLKMVKGEPLPAHYARAQTLWHILTSAGDLLGQAIKHGGDPQPSTPKPSATRDHCPAEGVSHSVPTFLTEEGGDPELGDTKPKMALVAM